MSGLARFTTDEPVAAPDPLAEIDGSLRRFLRPREILGEVCEFCGVPIYPDHRHVVDLEMRGMLCACRGCGLLFIASGAAPGRYWTTPERYLKIEPFTLTPMQWASLQIPVGIAFVVRNTQLEQTVAFYPSPGGATESELPLAAWDDIVAANPVLQEVEPDVEAALVRSSRATPGSPGTVPEQTECYVVPVDRCYELVGALRFNWKGFDGGQEAREAIDNFFIEVAGRAKVRA